MTTTIAENILSRLTEYEANGGDNVFDDIISRTTGYDYAATEDADPTGRSTVAVFTDGSSVRFIEDRRVWAAE